MFCMKLNRMRGKADPKEATNAEEKVQHSSLIFPLKAGHIKSGCLITNAPFLCAIFLRGKKKGHHS